MKQLSQKLIDMKASSVRRLTKHAEKAEAGGKKIYRLNIGHVLEKDKLRHAIEIFGKGLAAYNSR